MGKLTDLEITPLRGAATTSLAIRFRWNGERAFVWWNFDQNEPSKGQPIRWLDISGRRRGRGFVPAQTSITSKQGKPIIEAVRAALTPEVLANMRAEDQAAEDRAREERRQAIRLGVAERHSLRMLALLELIDTAGAANEPHIRSARTILADVRHDIKSALIVAGDNE